MFDEAQNTADAAAVVDCDDGVEYVHLVDGLRIPVGLVRTFEARCRQYGHSAPDLVYGALQNYLLRHPTRAHPQRADEVRDVTA